MLTSKPHRSSQFHQNNSRTKNVVPTFISPLLVDVIIIVIIINELFFNFRLFSYHSKRFRSGASVGSKNLLDYFFHDFEMAERCSSGVTELFVRDLLAIMVPNMSPA